MSQNKAHNFNIHKNLYKGTKKELAGGFRFIQKFPAKPGFFSL